MAQITKADHVSDDAIGVSHGNHWFDLTNGPINTDDPEIIRAAQGATDLVVSTEEPEVDYSPTVTYNADEKDEI